jgi:Permuted papain-like amidase enzyme, YaeF/YiiX, C92 family
MKNSRIYFSLVSLFLTSFSCGEPSPTALLREGDIVFNSSPQGAGEAIMAATGSKFTHCGLVFSDKGRLMVIEAVQPVRVVSLETFQTHSPAGTFTVRRLKNRWLRQPLPKRRSGESPKSESTTTHSICGTIEIFIAPSWFGKLTNMLG